MSQSRRPFTTTLLVPTLNEIDGMRSIMPQIRREWVDQILILDAGSTDGTVEYAREQGYELVIQKRPGIRAGRPSPAVRCCRSTGFAMFFDAAIRPKTSTSSNAEHRPASMASVHQCV